MRQRSLAMSTSRRNEIVAAMFESQYLVGAVSPSGHSISNVSCGRAAAPVLGAVRTCTRAKRERSGAAEPSRHVMVRQAWFGKLHKAMKALLPGAVFIGFTGTPLLKDDVKTSREVFGDYIHTYKF